jgi:hypothetical protein
LKEAVELASLGLAKPIKDVGFQLEFNSLAHLVQKLTSYEQRHPEIYQDKFKCQITLVDTEDAADSGEEREVAVAEWIRGANPVSLNESKVRMEVEPTLEVEIREGQLEDAKLKEIRQLIQGNKTRDFLEDSQGTLWLGRQICVPN